MSRVITVTAPLRIDLAGGTLDIWPINRCLPGALTVNAALALAARVTLTLGGRGVTLAPDGQRPRRYPSLAAVAARPTAGLVERVLGYYAPHWRPRTGVHLTWSSDSPRGAGLWGSSALTVALLAALQTAQAGRVDRRRLIPLAKDLETAHIQTLTGDQDYYPACHGGVLAIHYRPGGDTCERLPVPRGALERHLVLAYSHAPRFSGVTNWAVVQGYVERKPRIRRGLADIAARAGRLHRALIAGRWGAAARLVAEEGAVRARLNPGILTPELRDILRRARRAGAWGGKVCGAGGGGCILLAAPGGARDRVAAAVADVATVLPCTIRRRRFQVREDSRGR